MMNLLILHTEAIDEEASELFAFMNDKGISIPVMIVGEEADSFHERIGNEAELAPDVSAFEKPYPIDSILSYVDEL